MGIRASSPFIQGLADVIVTRRFAVVVVVLLLTALLGSRIPRLRANFTPEDLFARSEEQAASAASFEEAFGNTDNIVLVLVQAEDVLSVDALQYIHDLSRRFEAQQGIANVASITATPLPRTHDRSSEDVPRRPDLGTGGLGDLLGVGDALARFTEGIPDIEMGPVIDGDRVEPSEAQELRRALADLPLLEGKLVSRDRQVAAVVLELDHEVQDSARVGEVVGEVAEVVESTPAPDGVQSLLAGLPYLRLVMVAEMRADQTVLLPAAILVCLIILAIAFKWPAAVTLSALAVVMSAVMVVGGMALVGEPVNIINNIVPFLVLIIGISSAIHFVTRYGDEYRALRSRESAGRRALGAMTVALFLTSFTTAVGFGSLMVSTTPMLSRFGITAAIGIMLAYVVSITFLPAALMVAKVPPRRRTGPAQDRIERLISWSTRLVIRRRWQVLFVSGVATAVVVIVASRLDINASVLDQFDEDDEMVVTTRLIEAHLDGIRALEVSLESPREGRFDEPDVLNAMSAVQRWAEAQPGVLSTTSYAELLHEVWYRLSGDPSRRDVAFDNGGLTASLSAMLANSESGKVGISFVTPDRRRARINIQVAESGSQAINALIAGLEARIGDAFGPLEEVRAHLTGDAVVTANGMDRVMRDLATSVLTAFVIIFGFLALFLRSWRLGLLSIPPNVIPLLTTMAYMVIRGIPLNLSTVIIFSVSIGMAVDGTIHVLARFREELTEAQDVDQALLAATRGTGKAILYTCLSLVLGFSVLFLSTFPPVRRFGELIAVTMGTCLLATLILVPALLRVSFPSMTKAQSITAEYDRLDLEPVPVSTSKLTPL